MLRNELINPRSIAVVGGSNDMSKPGGTLLRNIINGGYNLSRVFASKKDAIEYRNITKTYEYWQKSRWRYDEDGLCYTIKPIPGEKINLDKLKLETREITRFSSF